MLQYGWVNTFSVGRGQGIAISSAFAALVLKVLSAL